MSALCARACMNVSVCDCSDDNCHHGSYFQSRRVQSRLTSDFTSCTSHPFKRKPIYYYYFLLLLFCRPMSLRVHSWHAWLFPAPAFCSMGNCIFMRPSRKWLLKTSPAPCNRWIDALVSCLLALVSLHCQSRRLAER